MNKLEKLISSPATVIVALVLFSFLVLAVADWIDALIGAVKKETPATTLEEPFICQCRCLIEEKCVPD